ncbi:MAG: HEAT repeat domain-containing protein [Myxococcales bacterium]|nr:HEAT repeat domain-containing protein [Myxococcales bacterium]
MKIRSVAPSNSAMQRRCPGRASRTLRHVAIVVALALVAVAAPGVAWADNVDVLIRDVKGGSDYKVRLSAVLALAKLGDQRGVPALVGALADGDKTVRGAAAVALGKVVTAATPATTRAQARTALEKLLARDSTDSVKKVAAKTLKKLDAIDAATITSPVTTGGVFVLVAEMASKAEPELKALAKKTAQTTLSRKAKEFMQTWPSGKAPTKKDLTSKKVSGFYLDGTVNEVTVKQKGASATVSCKISMLIASYPEKSIFAVLTGNASVAGSNDESDIALAKQDCVAAVIEDLVASKVVPTIRTKAAAP